MKNKLWAILGIVAGAAALGGGAFALTRKNDCEIDEDVELDDEETEDEDIDNPEE